jgi:uncharacterized protein (TIGR02145 family)
MKFFFLSITFASTVFMVSCAVKPQQGEIEKTVLIDNRDGKEYKTVKIGEQVWMAENLNYDAEGSVCYENNPANCAKYGRLYNWETAMKICPKGWHLPNFKEWDKLYRFADGNKGTESPYNSKTAGKYLKANGGWNEDGNGTECLRLFGSAGRLGFEWRF